MPVAEANYPMTSPCNTAMVLIRYQPPWLIMHPSTAESSRNIAFYAITFMALFFVFQLIYQNSRSTHVEDFIITGMTVMPSAALISWLTPEEDVTAQGHRLVSSHVRMSVLNGCEGTEVILLLCAALLAFRMPWQRKLSGVVLGSLLIYTANQVRIVALYYCLRFDHSLFAPLHGYIAPIAVIIVAVIFFFYWTAYARRNEVI